MALPLKGIRVIDLTRLLPGPYCSLLLSDLGAEVIKIEDKSAGDGTRYYPPFVDSADSKDEQGDGIMFHALNRGKKSVELNLKSPKDRTILLHLLTTADVLIESFRPNVLEKLLGISHIKELQARFPHLIICRISSYGQNTGSLSSIPAHDMNCVAMAGVFPMAQSASTSPLPVQLADLISAWSAALQIVAALLNSKNKSDSGVVIDVSMLDAAFSSLIMPASRHLLDGAPVSQGNDYLSGALPCYSIYPTKDGLLSVGCLEPVFWIKFIKAIGLPQKLNGKLFASGKEADDIKALIESKLKEKSAAEWETEFLPLELPVTRINSLEEILDKSNGKMDMMTQSVRSLLEKRGMLLQTRGNEKSILAGTPLDSSLTGVLDAANGAAAENVKRAPRKGEHTAAVLAPILSKL